MLFSSLLALDSGQTLGQYNEAGLGSLEEEWRQRVEQEQSRAWQGQVCAFLLGGHGAGRERVQWEGLGVLRLLHSLASSTWLILQHTRNHFRMLADARSHGARAIYRRATNRLLQQEAQHRSLYRTAALAQHGILVDCLRQRNAMVCEEATHRLMYGAAACRDIAYLSTQALPLPLTEDEAERLSEYTVQIRPEQLPIFPHRPFKRSQRMYELDAG